MPTKEARAIITAALRGLERCWRDGYAYSKAGVMLSEFTPEDIVQTRLFEEDDPCNEHLQVVIDSINERWGRDTIRYAASGIARPWAMKQEHRTPRYTTKWDELLESQ
jgi:DNA polymerase V